jgi:NAD(P)-dependent dehydrogenase (short-subunit alcohol dehydrogenase family)
VLVNNAAVMALADLAEVEEAAIRRTIEVNLLGAVHGMQLALARMLPRSRGHLINVSSVSGRWGIPGENVYVATKFGLDGLAQLARAELRGTGVHITTVYMGPVADTELSLGMRERGLIRFSNPQEIAAAIVGAARDPRPEVWVPRSLGPVVRAINLLPWRLRLRSLQALGVLEIATDIDRRARSSYERRLVSQATE